MKQTGTREDAGTGRLQLVTFSFRLLFLPLIVWDVQSSPGSVCLMTSLLWDRHFLSTVTDGQGLGVVALPP